ncbi:branched-chain amino acid transport system substrate-binding protein [Natronorubrum sediminis]|uniref:Branched-chain amino acid transport system substrate-binding protein n=2 Tax=Natronorubrum sediminis TaxID=640943 RepID=A0A1H6FPV4_9EURY|nr:branched-chain amino acid transport system substrate-binding protein [Natronorubrum sediminis]
MTVSMVDTDRWGRQAETATRDDRTRRPNRRQFVVATAGVAGGVSLGGCVDSFETVSGSTTDDETITIGALAPDPADDYIGQSIVHSAELAVEELANNGGINGHDVDIAIADTKSSPLEARREYQRLVLEEDVDVTVGMFASEALLAILDDIAEHEIIHLTSGAATTVASQLVNEEYDRYKYHFRVGPTNDADLGRMQVDFLDDMSEEIGWESIALFAEDYEWTEAPWEVYQEQIAGTGVEIATEERYPPATDDFTELYTEAEEQDADAVFITTAHTGDDALLDWAVPQREFAFGGIHVPMQLPAYYDLVDQACRYGVGQTSATATSEITDLTQHFVGEYQDAYDGSNPVYTGYHTYDAVMLFADAVEQADTLDSDELVSTLEDAAFTGSAGLVEFHEPDHEYAHDLVYQQDENLYFQWQENDDGEGVQEVIWPEAQATADYVAPAWLE